MFAIITISESVASASAVVGLAAAAALSGPLSSSLDGLLSGLFVGDVPLDWSLLDWSLFDALLDLLWRDDGGICGPWFVDLSESDILSAAASAAASASTSSVRRIVWQCKVI